MRCDNFVYGTITRYGSTFQWIQLLDIVHLPKPWGFDVPLRNTNYATAQAHHEYPRSNLRPTRYIRSHKKFRLFRFRSPLLTESC